MRVAPLVLLAACGPISLPHAEQQCFDEARLAKAPRGEVAIGAGTGGARARVTLDITSDFLAGRDPSAVYDQCVVRRSGQLPSRPLYSRPDWKG
jgi:hypothetical protein